MPVVLKDITIPAVSVVAVVGALFGGANWIQGSIKESVAEVASDVQAMKESVASLDRKVAVMDGSRFTSANGLEVWQAIAAIKSEIVRLETRQLGIIERIAILEKK